MLLEARMRPVSKLRLPSSGGRVPVRSSFERSSARPANVPLHSVADSGLRAADGVCSVVGYGAGSVLHKVPYLLIFYGSTWEDTGFLQKRLI